jgi:hypothetical protein
MSNSGTTEITSTTNIWRTLDLNLAKPRERKKNMKKIKSYGSKKFLTPGTDSATGAICSYVGEGYGTGVEASVQVKDCNRGVTLEFSIYSHDMNKQGIRKMTNKIDTMVNELLKFKQAFEKAAAIALENKIAEGLDKSENP